MEQQWTCLSAPRRSPQRTRSSSREIVSPTSTADNLRLSVLKNARAHLYTCSTPPVEIRRLAKVARETSRALVKRGRELGDRADVLMREAEVRPARSCGR